MKMVKTEKFRQLYLQAPSDRKGEIERGYELWRKTLPTHH